jgi:hypothetical protein
MSQALRLNIKGLYTHPNPFSEVPPGALSLANNIVIDRESIAESRRGYFQYAAAKTGAKTIFNYQDVLMLHYGTKLAYDLAGTWTDLSGTFSAPSSLVKIRSAELQKALFFTSDTGIQRLDSPSGTPRPAGVSPALDLVASVVAGTILANTFTVAYRLLWGYTDVNGQLVLGAPSARALVTNSSGGARDVSLNFSIPSDITTADFYQLYRSEQVVGTPSDEMQLVRQASPSAGEITAKAITVTDSIPDANKGAFIYTAATQEGAAQANTRPPMANDITEYKQHLFYANTQQRYSTIITIITNLAINDTVTINSVVYTGKAAETIASREFLIGADIATTMRSLIRVVNRYTLNTTVSAYELTPNVFQVAMRALPGASFTVNSSVSTKFSTPLPATANNETRRNRVYISKLQRGDAVPVLNYIDCGSGNEDILRVIANRDAVFVLKTDGVWRISGDSVYNFSEELHDNTVSITAANAAVKLNNFIFAICETGLIAISNGGIEDKLGRPIERTLLALKQLTSFDSLAHSIAYDSDRKYILACPTLAADTYSTQMLVLNFTTGSWTRWTIPSNAGTVSTSDDKLYIIRASDDQTIKERKEYTTDDYADDEYAVTITTSTATTVSLSSLPGPVVVGMTLRQGLSTSVITAINALVLTVADSGLLWTAAAAKIYTPINIELEYVQEDMGNPGFLKHFSEVTFLFDEATFDSVTARFKTNFERSYLDTTLEGRATGDWGAEDWDDFTWGGAHEGQQALRTYLPREVARAHWLNIRLDLEQAFTGFSLSGVSLLGTLMSSRFK